LAILTWTSAEAVCYSSPMFTKSHCGTKFTATDKGLWYHWWRAGNDEEFLQKQVELLCNTELETDCQKHNGYRFLLHWLCYLLIGTIKNENIEKISNGYICGEVDVTDLYEC